MNPSQESQADKRPVVQAPQSDDAAEATAAARELVHFGLDSDAVKSLLPSPLGSVVDVPQVGRVQATFSPALPDKLPKDIRELSLQPSIERLWRTRGPRSLDAVSGAVLCGLRDFRDVIFTKRLPPAAEARLRRLCVAHAVAHVLRNRARLKRHDAALNEDTTGTEAPRDQGFTRARVLILAPMRNVAYEIVNMIVQLLSSATSDDEWKSVAFQARFKDEFGPDEDDGDFDIDAHDEPEDVMEAASAPYERGKRLKPVDFRHTFRGNLDDDFKVGIQLSGKQVKLYSDFYDSDIIIASPLGIRRTIAAKADGYHGGDKKKTREDEKEQGDGEWKTGLSAAKSKKQETPEEDDGFLSSVEICLVDSAHVFEMQNWDTFVSAMRHINNMPQVTGKTDFSRVREWALDGLMKEFRQTIIMAAYRSPQLCAVVRTLRNHAGRLNITEGSDSTPAQALIAAGETGTSVRQTFVKIANVETAADGAEKRVEYFTEHTLPLVRSMVDAVTMVIIPSYFDFVRMRNVMLRLQKEEADFSFVSMCEYSRAKDVSRARVRLGKGRRQVRVAIVTERFHFYWRHWIKNFNTVVWYALPSNAHFYAEFINMAKVEAALDEDNINSNNSNKNAQCIALFDNMDGFALERIVGTKRAKRMTSRKSKSTFLFLS